MCKFGMISLLKGNYQSLSIQPRWPAGQVLVDEGVLEKLVEIQLELPDNVGLIITRAYEESPSRLGLLRKVSRVLGIFVFKTIYQNRKKEVKEIFGSNGHDVDGTHVDVSFSVNGKRARLLPFSVFTPLFIQRWRVEEYHEELDLVKECLVRHGFKIHANETESLQIHCDYSLHILHPESIASVKPYLNRSGG